MGEERRKNGKKGAKEEGGRRKGQRVKTNNEKNEKRYRRRGDAGRIGRSHRKEIYIEK